MVFGFPAQRWSVLIILWLTAAACRLPPALTVFLADTDLASPTPNAQVVPERGGLRLRAFPGPAGRILRTLAAGTPLIATGRTEDGTWLAVLTGEGESGWVWADFVAVNGALDALPVPGEVVGMQPPATTATFAGVPVLSGLTPNARRIFLRGQALGNRAAVFSKIGDSLTAASYFLTAIGEGRYNLGAYPELAPVVEHFRAADARDGVNPFANRSLAAHPGWSTWSVLQPDLRPDQSAPDPCQPGESPLECEYRVVRPAVALILLGTNDVHALSPAAYRANLTRIVELSIARGVIPVLSTLPGQAGYEDDVPVFNAIVAEVARTYEVPLWDYGAVLAALPDGGLSADGVHPSIPPEQTATTAVFTADNLVYGFTVRNLTALMVLDVLWRQVMY